MGTQLKISDLAAQTGTTTPTVRYYESVGLLPYAARQAGGQRRYDASDIRRLLLIRRCRDFGFSIEQVRTLVDLVENPSRDCTEVLQIAEDHLRAIRKRMTELRALEKDIAAFAARCATSCVGGPGPSCIPLIQLGSPSHSTVKRPPSLPRKARENTSMARRRRSAKKPAGDR